MHITKSDLGGATPNSPVSRRTGTQVLLVHGRVDTGKHVFACLQKLGYDLEYAESSRRACEILEAHHHEFGVIVLDVGTAIAEGYNIAETVRCSSEFRSISIVTLCDNNEDAARIYATAGLMPLYNYNYPFDPSALDVTLKSAIAESQRKRDLELHVNGASASFDILESCRFSVRTLQDVERSAYMAAACFPQPARAIHGLEELLLNAVEHGNLEIGHDRKLALLKSGAWMSEIESRLSSDNFGSRKVDFALVKREGGTSAVITDEGAGFDWQSILSGKTAEGVRTHGRGISRARLMSFDKLTFNQTGNRVVALMRDSENLDW